MHFRRVRHLVELLPKTKNGHLIVSVESIKLWHVVNTFHSLSIVDTQISLYKMCPYQLFSINHCLTLSSPPRAPIEMAVSFRSVISPSVRSLTIQMISRYNMGPGEHRIFRRKYSTKTCFDEVKIRQNDNSTKSFFDEMVQ